MLLQKRNSSVVAAGAKTTVRKFERNDVDRWLQWPPHSDALFATYNPPRLTPRQRDHYFKLRESDPNLLQFAVEDRHGQLVGRISLREIDWQLRTSVLGLTFHPHRLGEGLGTDGLVALLGHYFGVMTMSAAFLDVAAFNKRALRCYEKCGFRICGHRWGDAQPDYAGVMRLGTPPEIRAAFRQQHGFVRPLLIDMALRRADFLRLRLAREREVGCRA
jgi:RimJ/RimL family protein N-acetyltransferase